MRKTIVMLLLAAASSGLQAQGLQGTWSGQLDAGAMKLLLVLHIGPGGCTIDSPDQGKNDIETRTDFLSDDSVSISIPSVAATYNGKLVDGELHGVFKQMGYPLQLNMKRGETLRNRPQTPQPPYPYETEDVTFRNGDVTLAGTLTMPAKGSTLAKVSPIGGRLEGAVCVVMVTGSGLQNRDEELFGHKPFAVLADYLARRGIASLRYDDRGFGLSTGNGAKATTPDFCADAAAAIDYVRSLGRFGKVGIVGHSEGGTIAIMLAAQQKADFIVALAAPGVRGDSIVVRQNYDLARLSGQNVSYEQCAALLPSIRQQMAGNAWYTWFLDYDPAADLARIGCPALFLNGEKDTQVNARQNLHAIEAGMAKGKTGSKRPERTEKVVCRSYAGLNHLFQHCTTGLPVEYGQIEETIAEEAMADIAEWIDLIMHNS